MDSLGSKHPQAIKLLQTYLQLEASDKKGIDDASKAEGKRAQVSKRVVRIIILSNSRVGSGAAELLRLWALPTSFRKNVLV